MGASLRVLAGAFFLFAAIAIAADVARYAGSGRIAMTSLAAHWQAFSPIMLKNAQAAVSNGLSPLVWDPIIWRVISLPAWFLFGALGVTFAYLGRAKRRVNIFIN